MFLAGLCFEIDCDGAGCKDDMEELPEAEVRRNDCECVLRGFVERTSFQ